MVKTLIEVNSRLLGKKRAQHGESFEICMKESRKIRETFEREIFLQHLTSGEFSGDTISGYVLYVIPERNTAYDKTIFILRRTVLLACPWLSCRCCFKLDVDDADAVVSWRFNDGIEVPRVYEPRAFPLDFPLPPL